MNAEETMQNKDNLDAAEGCLRAAVWVAKIALTIIAAVILWAMFGGGL